MNRIRLLPEQVCNQIAAGEVVERPASVVKELVENALDAGASRIDIDIQAGGRSLIRVSDDGMGMSRDDALLCLERHATSKIQRAEDLQAVQTMGFRGEALPSIASISRFTLTTRERTPEQAEATQVVVHGGKIVEVKSAGAPSGTSVEVRQMFFNLPARRKFLRSEETEYAHIQHYLTLAALSHPEVAFAFHREGKLSWHFPAIPGGEGIEDKLKALRTRLKALYGHEQKFLPLDFVSRQEKLMSDEPGMDYDLKFKLWGFIGPPGVSRATREDQHLFVNRRPVENRGLNFALLEGYHTALMKGRYPVCCLFFEIDPAAVDVNIHPSKREVKFHQEAVVRKLVARAIQERLLQFHSNRMSTDKPAEVQGRRTPAVEQPRPQASIEPLPPTPKSVPPSQGQIFQVPPFSPKIDHRPSMPGETSGGGASKRVPTSELDRTGPSTSPALSSPETVLSTPDSLPRPDRSPTGLNPEPLLNVPLRLVGVIGRLYVVLESDRGLVLMDQHAAHERVLYEQMLNRLEQSATAPSQRLLLPETIELSAPDTVFLKGQLETLARLGVGLNEFGERTFLLDALPPFVKVKEPRSFVMALVDELRASGQSVNTLRLGEQVVAKTVCRHAVKANDPLNPEELENLLHDLRHCSMPYTCPHGRPTLIEMNYRELEKKFGRQQ